MERMQAERANEQAHDKSAMASPNLSAPLQRQSGQPFGDSPRQKAQASAIQRQQNGSLQTAQRQGVDMLQRASPAGASGKSGGSDGLPEPLRSNMEAMSGVALDDVRVHQNSAKPAQVQAHAYAQGRDIYLGSGQERHLPHETWHVVQQAQGRVKPTRHMKGKVAVNDDVALEREADLMGAKAMQLKFASAPAFSPATQHISATHTLQRQASVYLHTNAADRKTVVATGRVDEFVNGSGAGSKGWVGVDKYRARYKIEDDTNKNEDEVGPLQNVFTTAEAGHVLASRNGGDGSDPKNIFAQCGGTNNSTYKAFEGRMRGDLNLYDAAAAVTFVCYLEGRHIHEGVIADTALSDASDIESDFSD